LFADNQQKYIPEPLRGGTHYVLTSKENYQSLYDFLLGQAGVKPREVGELKRKPPARGQPLTFPGESATNPQSITHNPQSVSTTRPPEQFAPGMADRKGSYSIPDKWRKWLNLRMAVVFIGLAGALLAGYLVAGYMARRGARPLAEAITNQDNSAAIFISPISKWKFWSSQKDSGWMHVGGVCNTRGRRIRGETVGLFKTMNAENAFNSFEDFILLMNVKFVNGKGVAWIVRAKDFDNYYLFELTAAKSESRKKQLNFYICVDGKLDLVESVDVFEEIDVPCDSFDIYTLAIGQEYHVFFRPLMPNRAIEVLIKRDFNKAVRIGKFHDKNFLHGGGVGFYPRQGMDILLQQMVVMPKGTSEFDKSKGGFPE